MVNALPPTDGRSPTPGRWVTPGGIDRARAATLAGRARAAGRGWVLRTTAEDILAAYGIAVLPASYAFSGVGAVAAAECLGYPIVLRTPSDPDGDRGKGQRVRPGLTCAAAVRAAYDALTRPDDPVREVILQRQISAPVKLTAGFVRDPHLGAILRLRAGGRRVARLVPLTDLDAGRMCRELPRAVSAAAAAIEDLLLRISCLAEDHPGIERLDLDPVSAGPDGIVVADARLRLGD